MSANADGALGAVVVHNGAGRRRVALVDYLDASLEEDAAAAAHAWIKALRHASVDGQPLRRRFQFRGDSLWWFAELYLHKQQVALNLHRTIAALDRLISRERPLSLRAATSGALLALIGPQRASAQNVRWVGRRRLSPSWLPVAAIDARARVLMLASRASRLRGRGAATQGPAPARVAAFVHNAFWRGGAASGGAESYIGPVLEALEASATAVRYVGVGPGANFGARRWWHAVTRPAPSGRVTPVELFAGTASMRESRRIWRERHSLRRALWNSPDLRRHTVVQGCDCWGVIRGELAGVALLQWPWSARAMDEAGAALDALRPDVVVTYAEAGGWGRALLLECRRRGIPSAGLQHGFIYRHWLNYRHEEDEMMADPQHPEDAGFPGPTLTLLFDEYARQHLASEGRFPLHSLRVTGSPRLDALVRSAQSLSEVDIERARSQAGGTADRPIVLFVAKYREARRVLDHLSDALRTMPDVQLAIKTHPAETPDAYAAVAARTANVRVLPADAPLAPLLRASRALLTVNSTVAIDAAVLGLPALVLGLPNNLSPFVDAGLMAGVPHGDPLEPALRRILYDEGFRQQLERDGASLLARFGIGSDGRAAARSAEAILDLASAEAADAEVTGRT